MHKLKETQEKLNSLSTNNSYVLIPYSSPPPVLSEAGKNGKIVKILEEEEEDISLKNGMSVENQENEEKFTKRTGNKFAPTTVKEKPKKAEIPKKNNKSKK